jgi:hypothetical protein
MTDEERKKLCKELRADDYGDAADEIERLAAKLDLDERRKKYACRAMVDPRFEEAFNLVLAVIMDADEQAKDKIMASLSQDCAPTGAGNDTPA